MHQRASQGSEEVETARDTIAAISTAAGEGAIAIVRLSGARAIEIADKIFRGKKSVHDFQSHVQHLGEIAGEDRTIDQGIIAVHRAPNSYTGEDLVEISCHGGALVSAKVLDACLAAGARGANAGEFTERAYLNGKMDLTQAEAVIDLIRAQSDLALRSATEQLRGRLGERFLQLRQRLVHVLAHVEAGMDFPEEGISPANTAEIDARLRSLLGEIEELLATAQTGRILREGLRVVIFGATNAGKSSLLNRLLRFDRAIVNESHGTTRDTIEERLNLRGIPLRLFDTAGFREPETEIERQGMERSTRSLEAADLRLHIVDASAPRPADFPVTADELLILNKSDLPEHDDWKNTEALRISCKTGQGLRELEEQLFQKIGQLKVTPENPLAINARHRNCLTRAQSGIDRALKAIAAGATAEIFAADLHEAQAPLDELLGGGDEEVVRDEIFSQFCIGK